jgi:hypothetical protein
MAATAYKFDDRSNFRQGALWLAQLPYPGGHRSIFLWKTTYDHTNFSFCHKTRKKMSY